MGLKKFDGTYQPFIFSFASTFSFLTLILKRALEPFLETFTEFKLVPF